MQTIENGLLKISISEKGAELQSIVHKNFSLEYLWSGDPAFWSKKSPVLFPIVGSLKKNNYEYNGELYSLGRHGFARDMDFTVSWQKADAIMFSLHSNNETLTKYPFPFLFSVRYTLVNNELCVTYIVQNTSHKDLYFSVGGHPAFKLPLTENTVYEDYYLRFGDVETAGRWPLSKDGLIEEHPVHFLMHARKLPLKKSLFYEDAIVLKNLRSNFLFLLSNKTSHGIKFHFDNFPYLGIWAAKDADFICIEPWCGIADNVNASGKLTEKEGIIKLKADESFERTWSVELF